MRKWVRSRWRNKWHSFKCWCSRWWRCGRCQRQATKESREQKIWLWNWPRQSGSNDVLNLLPILLIFINICVALQSQFNFDFARSYHSCVALHNYIGVINEFQFISRLESRHAFVWTSCASKRVTEITFATPGDRVALVHGFYYLLFCWQSPIL